MRTDVRSLADAAAATAAAVEAWGRLDILVNNAARAIGGVVDAIDEATWNEVISTNLTSVWRFMKCAVPQMRAQGGGAIVNISSVQALRGFHGWAAYAAAKGGINALTQQAAVDLAPDGIRVNAVAPGTIMTPLNEKVFRETADPQELIDRWNAAHPLGRFGQPGGGRRGGALSRERPVVVHHRRHHPGRWRPGDQGRLTCQALEADGISVGVTPLAACSRA